MQTIENTNMNPEKLAKAFYGDRLESLKESLCRQDAVIEMIKKAYERKAVATNLEYYTLFELENERKERVAHWDAVILRLTNYLINLSRKGAQSHV